MSTTTTAPIAHNYQPGWYQACAVDGCGEPRSAHQDALRPAPAAFTIAPDLDVTKAHGAPSARVYGQCQAATTLARCMGSRVAYAEVDGNRWRMERQEGTAVWVAIDMTALAAFAL